jgi:predicted DNA-binding ribbon-helix-helix protein
LGTESRGVPTSSLFCLVIPAPGPAISNQCMKVKGKGGYGGLMKSSVLKRSIVIDGHKTSVSLEDAFWNDLKEIAHSQQVTLSKLIAQIDDTRQQGGLSSAIRLYVLDHVRTHGKVDPKGRRN